MKKIIIFLSVFIFICGIVCAAAVSSKEISAHNKMPSATKSAKKWDQMTDKEKEEAKAAYVKMNEMSQDVKDYLDNGGKKFENLTVADKKKLKKAYSEWEKLSPQMKETMLEKYRQWTELSPEQREKIKEAYIKYKSASPEEKAKIREEVKSVNKRKLK